MQRLQVDATILEQDKENIQPLPGGRSASTLESTLQGLSTKNKEVLHQQRNDFEWQLENFSELDDPLQVYVDYIKWTHDNYPQGANADSGLLALLERCTSSFRDVIYYKNDPRYLKVWLEYTNYSDSPKDIFVYLAKKEIGTELALYYEEFARYLELSGNSEDATQIYDMGIENKARPLARLEKSFMKFRDRNTLENPSNKNNDNPLRSVLSVKRGDNSLPIGSSSLDVSNKRPKLQVLPDEESFLEKPLASAFQTPDGIYELGHLKSRVKENISHARPWKGEKILQKNIDGQKDSKFEVYKDSDESILPTHTALSNEPSFQTIQDSTNGFTHTVIRYPGRNKAEKVNVNMGLLYDSGNEKNFDEVLACISKLNEISLNNEERGSIEEPLMVDKGKVDNLKQDNTLTIPLKDDDNSDKQNIARLIPGSPTMTMFSRMATNEVLSIFNNAGKNLSSEEDEDDKLGIDHSNYDGFTTETIQPTGYAAPNAEAPLRASGHKVNELSEVKTPRAESDDDSVQSSPFIERPLSNKAEENCFHDPLDDNLRRQLLSNLREPLSTYPGFSQFCHTKINKLKKYQEVTNKETKLIAKGARNTIIDYCDNEIFCLRYELGCGGFGVVYLVETETGELKALKVENPSTVWEFYILNQIHRRLDQMNYGDHDMIIKPQSIYVFEDESYLLLNYVRQGTILDVVNYYRSSGRSVDEVLCVLLSVDMLKITEVLHSVGIIHGDLKADNCMVRFSHLSGWKGKNEDHARKSVTLIDFGRAVDMTLLDPSAQFIANWHTDQQDCPQMRKRKPWSYEADYYGLASVIHTLLFGKYIEVRESEGGRVELANNFRRYWQTHLWEPLFDMLLNPYKFHLEGNIKKPLIEELKSQRKNLEAWLDENASRKNLGKIIADLEFTFKQENKKLLSHLK